MPRHPQSYACKQCRHGGFTKKELDSHYKWHQRQREQVARQKKLDAHNAAELEKLKVFTEYLHQQP